MLHDGLCSQFKKGYLMCERSANPILRWSCRAA
jgi:hypothetical protein